MHVCLLHQEMEYSLPTDDRPYKAPVQNRFSGDCVALHMISTICRLTDQRHAAYNFLKNGGMAFAKSIQQLRKEDLAQAARVVDSPTGDALQQLLKNDAVPQTVKDAIQAMHGASATVLGTDGHRRHCRHEGVAYMETFGPPLIFLTPNIADTQHPLLLVIQGNEKLDLGKVTDDMVDDLPSYREMLRRIASDPVAQTVQFEFLMRLFFQHVLNVRPETLDCRRGGARATAREWCSDGAAASSTGAGMLGPVLAFRGEIEAQGRGSLHPHVLVWMLCGHLEVIGQLADLLHNNQTELQRRLKQFMHMVVASFESLSHASVQAAPRLFDGTSTAEPVRINKVASFLSKYDGGTDLDLLRELPERTPEQEEYLATAADNDWRRPEVQLSDDQSFVSSSTIFSQPVHKLAVAQTPKYRLRSVLSGENSPEMDAQAWQNAFVQACGNEAKYVVGFFFCMVFFFLGVVSSVSLFCFCLVQSCRGGFAPVDASASATCLQ